MKVPKIGLVLAALLILALVLYFGIGFFGDSVVQDDVSAIGEETLATGGTFVLQ